MLKVVRRVASLQRCTKVLSSGANDKFLVINQRRNFLTRHVPEPIISIHMPTVEAESETRSFVLTDGVFDESKPVILILGWAGAQPKHIQKYVDIYNKEGYRVISLCPPCYHPKIPNARVGFYMSPLFRATNAKPGDFRSFAKCPIIVHSFSMNGVKGIISFWKWTEAEERTELRDRIKGIIFDSAPARPTVRSIGKAMIMSTPPIDILEKASDETRLKALMIYLNIRNLFVVTLTTLLPFMRSFFIHYYYLRDQIKLPKNQLYLFSQKDNNIPIKHIGQFMTIQKERGAEVESISFEDTDHVRHYPEHEEQYREACLRLVRHIETVYKQE